MTTDGAVVLAVVALVPLVALMLSAFVKMSVVLALVRNAIGAPDAPPALVVTGLSLILTAFVMAPVAQQVVEAVAEPSTRADSPLPVPAATWAGWPPGPMRWLMTGPAAESRAGSYVGPTTAERAAEAGSPAGRKTAESGAATRSGVLASATGWIATAERAAVPVRAFLAKHAQAEDRQVFLALAREMRGAQVKDDDVLVLAAAFVTSELTEAFAIAFLVFIPFVVVDLVVGLALAALGLSATSPTTVSLPLKLLLFVAVDGWRLLFGGLIRGYL